MISSELLFPVSILVVVMIILFLSTANNLFTKLFGKEICLSKYREEINKRYKNVYSHQLVFKNRAFESEKNPDGVVYCRNYIKTTFDNVPYFSYDQLFTLRYRKSFSGNFVVVVVKVE